MSKRRIVFTGLYLEDFGVTIRLNMTETELLMALESIPYKVTSFDGRAYQVADTHLWHSINRFSVSIYVRNGAVVKIGIWQDFTYADPYQRYSLTQRWLTQLYGRHSFSFPDWLWRCKYSLRLRYSWKLQNARVIHCVHFYDINEFYDQISIQNLDEKIDYGS